MSQLTTAIEEGLECTLVAQSCSDNELLNTVILENVTDCGEKQRDEVGVVDLYRISIQQILHVERR